MTLLFGAAVMALGVSTTQMAATGETPIMDGPDAGFTQDQMAANHSADGTLLKILPTAEAAGNFSQAMAVCLEFERAKVAFNQAYVRDHQREECAKIVMTNGTYAPPTVWLRGLQ